MSLISRITTNQKYGYMRRPHHAFCNTPNKRLKPVRPWVPIRIKSAEMVFATALITSAIRSREPQLACNERAVRLCSIYAAPVPVFLRRSISSIPLIRHN